MYQLQKPNRMLTKHLFVYSIWICLTPFWDTPICDPPLEKTRILPATESTGQQKYPPACNGPRRFASRWRQSLRSICHAKIDTKQLVKSGKIQKIMVILYWYYDVTCKIRMLHVLIFLLGRNAVQCWFSRRFANALRVQVDPPLSMVAIQRLGQGKWWTMD